MFIILSNYLNCAMQLHEAKFVKGHLSVILFQHLLEYKITLKHNPLTALSCNYYFFRNTEVLLSCRY